ncbi:hypothetical protein [Streptomyces melanogenes]|uniref:hypothetical protein n=1 Tax=Streptomyces melanogenes TaxID=67326 RepID=UPI00167CBFBC|nr:hypothetical protein [Streptomyces melanogenes]GGP89117.1 hypothetical protein GCM10010278_79470 [Streptomyces melanogenes]
MIRFSRNMKRASVVAATAAVAAIAVGTSPAAAASGRSDSCNTYVCGSGTFTFGTKTLSGSLSARDNECNSKGVYIGIVVYHFDDVADIGTMHKVSQDCHGGYDGWYGLNWSDRKTIRGFAVVTKQEGNDYYWTGNYVDNPLT